jgi:hypothetical protein
VGGRRLPACTPVVLDNVETLYIAVAAGFERAALPLFVRRELKGDLDCGLPCRGFARLKCDSCVERHLVAFACKALGIQSQPGVPCVASTSTTQYSMVLARLIGSIFLRHASVE